MSAGSLNNRAAFKRPPDTEDEFAQVENGFQSAFTIMAGVTFRRGGEGVLAARLEARSPAIIRVRASTQTKTITAGWVVDIDGERFNIRETPRLTKNRLYYEFLAETGVSV